MSRPIINESGNRYGRLFVINRTEDYIAPSGRRSICWLCRCDCGNEAVIMGHHLRRGSTRSCGCLQKESASSLGKRNRLPPGVAAFNQLYSTHKRNAKYRGYSSKLTKQQFRKLVQQNCHYCGSEPKRKHYNRAGCNGSYTYNGVDRVDNTAGYTMNNCVSCCWDCNRAKGEMSENEFLDHIRKIANYRR